MQTRKVNTYGRRSIAIISAPLGIGGSIASSSYVLPDRSPSPDTPLSEISAGFIVLPNSPYSLTRSTVSPPPVKGLKKKLVQAHHSKKENVNLDLSALSISSPPATRRRKRQPLLVPSPKVKGSPKQSRVSKKMRASPNSPFRRIPLQRTNQAARVPSKTRESSVEISDDESYVSPKKLPPTRSSRSQAAQSKPTHTRAPRISESVIIISDDSIGPESHPLHPIPPLPPSKRPVPQPLSRQDAVIGTPPLLRRHMSGSRPSSGSVSRLSFGATSNAPPPLPPSPIILSDDLPSPIDSDDEMAFLDAAAELEAKPAPPPTVRSKSECVPRKAQPPFGSSKSVTKPPTAPPSKPGPQANKPIASLSSLKPISTSTKSVPLSSRPSIPIVELPAPKKSSKSTTRKELVENPPVIKDLNATKPPKSQGQPKPTKQPSSGGKSKSPQKPVSASTSLPPAPEHRPASKPNSSKISTKPTAKVRSRPQPTSSPYSPELRSLLEECSQSEPIDLGAFVATFSTDDVHLRFPSTTAGPRRRWQKVGEASYSEVFRLGGVVVKIVPLRMEHDGWNGVDGPCVSEMGDVQKEIAITRAMGDMQSGFIKLVKAYVAFGSYPQELLDLWDAYDREFESESIRPDSFLPSQMFVLLVLPDGGPDLEHYTFLPRASWRAAAGIFWQVARTLALAESLVRFEHRDMHWGQILVQNIPPKQKSKGSKLKAHSNTMDSPEHSGVRVTLIDLGLSRMDTHTRRAWFTDLEPEIFEGEGDYQFDVYRMMKAHCLGAEPANTGGWEDFRPLTNVMWLHYLARQLLRVKGLHDVDAEVRAFKCLVEVEKLLAASIVRVGGPAVSRAGGSILAKAAKSAGKEALRLVAAQNVSALAASFGAHVIKERLAEVPRGWKYHSKVPSSYPLKLKIALPQPNFDVLERELYEVSDPKHARYGQHLSPEEVNKLIAPHSATLTSVDEWLASHGFKISTLERSPARDWVTIVLPASKAEEMLGTEYAVWEHTESQEKIVRTMEYSLPESIHKHVHLITPTTMFGSPRPHKATFHYEDLPKSKSLAVTPDPSCNNTITISCLQALYNTGNYTATVKSNRLGIAGYLEEFANFADLQTFYKKYYPVAVGSNFTVESVNSGINPQDPEQAGGEAQLDVQYAGGISYPIQNIYYTTAGRPPFNASLGTPDNDSEPYLEFLQYLLAQKNPPQTISTSYGDEEQTVPIEYAKRVCGMFAQLGARGVTFLFSSGDFGVGNGGATNSTVCVSNDGKKTAKFLPAFPASCPYVTAVGGTHYVPEVAVDFSGGGFSDYFERPIYQAIDVPLYIKKLGGAYSGLYNSKGRAYPDIAAQGSHFRVIVGGTDYSIGGTSASAPTVAGIIALLNDARLAKKLPALGFLNPWLYTLGRFGLNDITAGNNPGCGTPGFNATAGWDPVTGLGTPNFGKLKKIAVP
ncbi:unnamed protein product [Rhizoctonia solani]|uniref:tripeptidyl-peptidase II n=1 Tax=Rhizoctonia solani TaxID=456999 RepID=A0A8H3DS65_9AGAM|nr:unnamed protein product [Rhizoctonia solani]